MGPAGKTPRDTFGQRLARARLTAGAHRGKAFTQTELARELGVTPPTVSQWESGASEPTLATIERIATALGVSPAYLAFGDQPPAPNTVNIGGLEIDPSTIRAYTPEEIEGFRRDAAKKAAPAPRTRRKKGH